MGCGHLNVCFIILFFPVFVKCLISSPSLSSITKDVKMRSSSVRGDGLEEGPPKWKPSALRGGHGSGN